MCLGTYYSVETYIYMHTASTRGTAAIATKHSKHRKQARQDDWGHANKAAGRWCGCIKVRFIYTNS